MERVVGHDGAWGGEDEVVIVTEGGRVGLGDEDRGKPDDCCCC